MGNEMSKHVKQWARVQKELEEAGEIAKPFARARQSYDPLHTIYAAPGAYVHVWKDGSKDYRVTISDGVGNYTIHHWDDKLKAIGSMYMVAEAVIEFGISTDTLVAMGYEVG
jgi:hypothetical protein